METVKHSIFLLLGVIAMATAWPYGIDWIKQGGDIFNLITFFTDALEAGGSAAFLTVDLLVMWLVFMIWVVFDAQRIGLGKKYGWGFLALSFIGVSLAFPIYLIVRERHLNSQKTAHSS